MDISLPLYRDIHRHVSYWILLYQLKHLSLFFKVKIKDYIDMGTDSLMFHHSAAPISTVHVSATSRSFCQRFVAVSTESEP